MVINREYVEALHSVRASLQSLKEFQHQSPKIAQVAEKTGLTEELILEALEFGSRKASSYIPYAYLDKCNVQSYR